jgi:hypothetical protein
MYQYMMKYPLQELEEVSRTLQEYIAEWRARDNALFDPSLTFEQKGQISFDSSRQLMNRAGIELFPKINRIIGEIESLLNAEDRPTVERVLPLLTEVKVLAQNPTNPLGYNELSAELMILSGHLVVGIVAEPKVFVGHRFTTDDTVIAKKFMELFKLEGLNCSTSEPAKPMNVNEKAQQLIAESEGVIIIFTPDKKIENSDYYTTSGWLNSELHYAMGKEKPYLIFYDDLIHPDERKGIHGDYEYVEFNRKCLDDAFLKTIPYLRIFNGRIITKNSDT